MGFKTALKPIYFVFLIFILVLAIRLQYSLRTDTFTGDESYFHVRQVDSIIKNGEPVFQDPLSYSGRQNIFSPVFHYILAAFAWLFGKTFALKILPQIFAASLVFIVYYLAEEISGRKAASLLASFASGFIPVFFKSTVNSLSTVELSLPLIFLALLFFIRSDKDYGVYGFVTCAVLIPLISPLAFIFVIGLVTYLMLSKLEYHKLNRREVELVLFATFITIWIELIVYKKSFLFHGYSVVWQNIPSQILNSYFSETTILEAIYEVGLIPLFFGVFTIYRYVVNEKDRKMFLMIGFAMAITLLLWLRLIRPEIGLMLSGIVMIVLFSKSFALLSDYIDMTKVARFKLLIVGVVTLAFIATSLLPAVALANESLKHAVSADEVGALKWLEKNAKKSEVVLAPVKEGHIVTALSGRKNVADTNFLLIHEAGTVLDDIRSMYTSLFLTNAVTLMDKYSVKYILVTPMVYDEFGDKALKYMNDECFNLVYDTTVKVYGVECEFVSS
jgi:hypothetical protein